METEGEEVWTAEELEKNRRVREESRKWHDKVRKRRRRKEERERRWQEEEEEEMRVEFLRAHEEREKRFAEMIRRRDEAGPAAGPSSSPAGKGPFLPAPLRPYSHRSNRGPRPSHAPGHHHHSPPQQRDVQRRFPPPRQLPSSPPRALHWDARPIHEAGPPCFRRSPSPRRSTRQRSRSWSPRHVQHSPPSRRPSNCNDNSPAPPHEKACGAPSSSIPPVLSAPPLTAIPPFVGRMLIPVQVSSVRRGLSQTPEWRRTMAQLTREVDANWTPRVFGSRVQKQRQRRRERKRLRREGDRQLEWYRNEVKALIHKYPVTEMGGKPPVYDYLSAMWRDSTKMYFDWAQRLTEHAEKKMRVWKFDVMDQVRRLRALYMDYTANYVLKVNALGCSIEDEDRHRAHRLRVQVTRQHEEFLRFMQSTRARRMLHPLTHADLENRDANAKYRRQHPRVGSH